MVNKLKESNLEEDINIYYQPIVRCSGGEFLVYKYEALVRFNKNNSVYPPVDFLEASKACGLYQKITTLVFCKTISALKEQPNLHLSMNLSYSDIENNNIKNFLLKKLARLNLEVRSRLTFEILETKKIEDLNMVAEFVKETRSFGTKIAIDDFGTEYANYDNLLNLDFDYVKIAGELIKDVAKSKKHFNVVRSLMELCRELETKVIAEYVENEKILKTLCGLNCEYMQGYLFGKPTASPAIILDWREEDYDKAVSY